MINGERPGRDDPAPTWFVALSVVVIIVGMVGCLVVGWRLTG